MGEILSLDPSSLTFAFAAGISVTVTLLTRDASEVTVLSGTPLLLLERILTSVSVSDPEAKKLSDIETLLPIRFTATCWDASEKWKIKVAQASSLRLNQIQIFLPYKWYSKSIHLC